MECSFLHAPHLHKSTEINERHTFFSFRGIICTTPRRGCVLARRSGGTESINGSRKKEPTKGWESEFLGEVENSKKVKEDKPWWFKDTQEMDWCSRARNKALKSIKERGLNRAVVSFMEKKKKGKERVKGKSTGKSKMKKVEYDSERDTEDESNVYIKQGVDSGVGTEIQPSLLDMGNVYRLSNRGEEFTFNKRIVKAKTAEEVYSVICGALLAVGKGTCPSCLSPLNIATAIHRIAKCMEESEMIEIHRLEFARRRETAILVSLAMISLPETPVQGISNIAWALSKIGGPLIYVSEMDRVAEVAITMVPSFESQDVANISGAFAAMKHSVPTLFAELLKRAIDIIHTFREQEICQLLWSFAYLSATVEPLLECLDRTFSDKNQVRSYTEDDTLTHDEEEDGRISNVEGKPDAHVLRFSRYELGNLAWSYVVFGEIRRVFFGHVWGGLTRLGESMLADDSFQDISFASQILLVNQSLKVEFQTCHPPLFNEFMERIALVRKNKKFSPRRTSAFQRDVGRLLFDTAFNWVKEHDLHCYSLDAALVDQKVAVEVDGPTHFSRNSGIPLGNTILKRRFITACGWSLIYISHQEWDALKGEKERISYLNGLLKGLKGIKLLPTHNSSKKNS